VARLVAPEIELAIAQQRGELAVKKVRVAQLATLRVLDSRYASQLPTAQAEEASAAALLAEHSRRAEELTLRSPLDGTVIAPPDRTQKVGDGQLATWAGSPLDGANQDCLLEPGMAICSVGNSERLAALLTVDERDIAEVQPGKSVRILLASAPVRILTGTVVQVASRAAEPSADDKSPLAGRTHLVEVQLDRHDPLARVGGIGTAKIIAERQTLGGLIISAAKRRLRLPW
jgi:multidrug resistance efflux pump